MKKLILLAFGLLYLLPTHYGQTVRIGGATVTEVTQDLSAGQGTKKVPSSTASYNYSNGYMYAKPFFGDPTNGQVPTFDQSNNRWIFTTPSGGGGGGTVTSVGFTAPNIFSVTGQPVTTSGSIGLSLASQAANTIFAGPTSGGNAAPTFRAMVAADVPALDAAKITTGIFGVARGGTGLSALGTANQLLRVNAGATSLEYFTPSYLTANQTITLSGDLSGSGTTSIAATIGNGAVNTAKLADAGVTMAKIAQAGATSGQVIKWNGSAWAPANDETAAGGGGVSSVGLSMPSLFSVTGSPVTSSGTLTAAFANQTANTFLAAPNGSAGPPTMRAIVAADIPDLSTSKITTGTFGTAFIADGAVTTAKLADAGVTMAKIAQAGATSGQVIKWNGTAWAPAADASNAGTVTSVGLSLPSIFSVSGSPVTASGTLSASLASQTAKHVFIAPSLADGAPTFRELLPSDINQAGATSGQVIKWNGTNWAPAADATGGGGGTDLSTTYSGTTVTIESSTGTDAAIAGASDTQAGVVTTGTQIWAGDKSFIGQTLFGGTMQTPSNLNFLIGDAPRMYRGAGSSGGSAVNQFDFYNSGLTTALARFRLQNGDASPRFLLQVGGTDVLTAHSTGVGIGTGSATPARALEVAGSNPIRTPGMTSSTGNMSGTKKMVVVNSSGDFGVDAIPSGGGSTTNARVVTSTTANSSGLTPVNAGLSYTIESGKSYRFTAYLRYSSSATTNGIGLTIDAPSNWAATANIQSTSSAGFTSSIVGSGVAVAPNCPATSGNICSISGEIFATSAGTLNIQFISETAGGTITVQADSQLFITKLD